MTNKELIEKVELLDKKVKLLRKQMMCSLRGHNFTAIASVLYFDFFCSACKLEYCKCKGEFLTHAEKKAIKKARKLLK